jgi:hypothetical protein
MDWGQSFIWNFYNFFWDIKCMLGSSQSTTQTQNTGNIWCTTGQIEQHSSDLDLCEAQLKIASNDTDSFVWYVW